VGIVGSKGFFTRGCAKGVVRIAGIRYLCDPILETMAKKGNRVQVILECTEHKESGMPGTSRYVTTKNRKNTPDRMEIKKFNPVLRKYTVHKEIK
jgi:large subunit ribosomal protein L33